MISMRSMRTRATTFMNIEDEDDRVAMTHKNPSQVCPGIGSDSLRSIKQAWIGIGSARDVLLVEFVLLQGLLVIRHLFDIPQTHHVSEVEPHSFGPCMRTLVEHHQTHRTLFVQKVSTNLGMFGRCWENQKGVVPTCYPPDHTLKDLKTCSSDDPI